MFKLSKEDKKILMTYEYEEADFEQIEKAADKTEFKLGDKPISRKEAEALLERTDFLSGLARSAFHWSAGRKSKDGQLVLFDSSKLFKE